MYTLTKIVILLQILWINAFPFVRDDAQCGFDTCNPIKEGFINVHLVPHTHDDVGWLKTVDQYYYGAKTSIQRAGVQYILDTVTESLRKNSTRKFIYAETAFFWKWWKEQSEERREIVRTLVQNGQLEFAGGGWCQNDEGATNYQSIIDQMTWGLRKLKDIFGDCGLPRVGWQIDPFGHSKGMAYIFALLGFDAFLLNRIDNQDFDHRRDTKTLEMVWRASANLGQESSIFTAVLPKHYNPPPGFCFDINCNDEPIIDNPRSPDYNVDQRVDDFISFLDDMSSRVATSNVLITMGDDFTYQDAETWYKNIDKLIRYTNERQDSGSKYNLIYSTASCYVKSVYDETKGKVNWTMKYDDFMPYADGEHALLTGYYTSRPTKKRFERESNNFLQICKQLSALTSTSPDTNLDYLREAMGAMQHHDAITGTEKAAVAEDYSRMLALGLTYCEQITENALGQLTSTGSNNDNPIKLQETFSTCRLANISQCEFTESQDNFVVTLYNPLSRPVTKIVRVPVPGTNYLVRNSEGIAVISQLQPVPIQVQNVPGREGQLTTDLIFTAVDIPPFGFESYYIQRIEGHTVLSASNKVPRDMSILVDANGLISGITQDDVTYPVSQSFSYYQGFVVPEGEPYSTESGAYVFRPIGPSTLISSSATYEVFNGPIVAEVHQVFNEWVSQIIKVYRDEPYIEFTWLVGPIPDEDFGKEVVSRFTTQLKTDSTFYTDSNGRELLKRIKNHRPTWDVNLVEEISGNFYPANSKIVLRDEENNVEFAVLTDRSEAASSLNDGEVELMVHRVCLGGDAFGETLQEEAFGQGVVARGSHFVIVGSTNGTDGQSVAAVEKDVAQRKLLDSWVFLSPTNGQSFDEYKENNVLKFAGLNRALPDNVQILTLEPWNENVFLLRLEHLFELDEDESLSQPVTVDLKDIFATFTITSLEETTLGGNQLLSDNDRLYFDESNTETAKETKKLKEDIDNLEITLNPMQIRTFLATVELTK